MGVFPQIPVEQDSFEDVMGDWRAHNARTLERLGPGPSKDRRRVRYYPVFPQAENADAGGQSETSRDSNKLVLCSALRPGQHAQAIVSRIPPEDLCAAKESDSLESGGQDWPDAYRHCPMNEDETRGLVAPWMECSGLSDLCRFAIRSPPGCYLF
eukprot:s8919_g3.t1